MQLGEGRGGEGRGGFRLSNLGRRFLALLLDEHTRLRNIEGNIYPECATEVLTIFITVVAAAVGPVGAFLLVVCGVISTVGGAGIAAGVTFDLLPLVRMMVMMLMMTSLWSSASPLSPLSCHYCCCGMFSCCCRCGLYCSYCL